MIAVGRRSWCYSGRLSAKLNRSHPEMLHGTQTCVILLRREMVMGEGGARAEACLATPKTPKHNHILSPTLHNPAQDRMCGAKQGTYWGRDVGMPTTQFMEAKVYNFGSHVNE